MINNKIISQTLNVPQSTITENGKKRTWQWLCLEEAIQQNVSDQVRMGLVRKATKIAKGNTKSWRVQMWGTVHRTTIAWTIHKAGHYGRVANPLKLKKVLRPYKGKPGINIKCYIWQKPIITQHLENTVLIVKHGSGSIMFRVSFGPFLLMEGLERNWHIKMVWIYYSS